jgi:hypothetical protein
MSQNCLEYAENLSVQHWVSNFDSLIRRVSLSNMEEAAKNTQTIEKQQRFKAVCIFAFAFAIQQYFQCISEDLLRLKGKHGMINIMKITYHSILFSINLLILPFSFFTGLIKTALFNRRITGNFS